MVALPFTPMALAGIALVVLAFGIGMLNGLEILAKWLKNCHWLAQIVGGCLGLCLTVSLALALALALYLPGVVIGTAGYMLYVLGAGCVKVVKPEVESPDFEERVLMGCVSAKDVKKIPPMLRMAEVATESYPQSILGEFNCLMSRFLKVELIPLPRHLHPADDWANRGHHSPDHPVRRHHRQHSVHNKRLCGMVDKGQV